MGKPRSHIDPSKGGVCLFVLYAKVETDNSGSKIPSPGIPARAASRSARSRSHAISFFFLPSFLFSYLGDSGPRGT